MYRLVTAHLGSVRAVVQWARNDAWGTALADSGAGFQPFGFAGGLTDAAAGLVRFGVTRPVQDRSPGASPSMASRRNGAGCLADGSNNLHQSRELP